MNLVLVLLSFRVTNLLRKPVVQYSQSIGPLGNRFQRWIARRTLAHSKLIITRESISTDFVKKMKLNGPEIIQSIDAGFLFPSDALNKESKTLRSFEKSQDVLVGITTKVHLSYRQQEAYERELAYFVDKIVALGSHRVVFIPQITSKALNEDDRKINTRIIKKVRAKNKVINVKENLTNRQTKAVIEKMNFMVGTRFHSVIFALTGLVPSIAIEYEHKTMGIMKDLNLSEWVVNMQNLNSEELFKLFLRLKKKEKQYKNHLQVILPGYKKKLMKTIPAIQKVYENEVNSKTYRVK